MKTFLKANIASLSASFCDYLITFILKQFIHLHPVVASILGTVAGGIINFIISRKWVFNSIDSPLFHQARKYAITWTGNLILNGLGVYLLNEYTSINYMVIKLMVSLTVAVAYNYPMQKNYVFKNIDNNEE